MSITVIIVSMLLFGNFICPDMNHSLSNNSDGKNPHMNNRLWTGFSSNGDIGTITGPSMEFPGASGSHYLLQGCQAIGFINQNNDTIVVATQLC